MLVTTIFGCFWVNTIIIYCTFNPLSITLKDSTTVSVEIIVFSIEEQRTAFYFNPETWPKLQGLSVDKEKYTCVLGECIENGYYSGKTVNSTLSSNVSQTLDVYSTLLTPSTRSSSVSKTIIQPEVGDGDYTPFPVKPKIIKHPEDGVHVAMNLLDSILLGTTGIFSFSTLIAILRCACRKKKLLDKFLRYCRRKNNIEAEEIAFHNPTYQRLDASDVSEENEQYSEVDLGDGEEGGVTPLNLSSFNSTSSTSGMSTFFSPMRNFINNSERLQRILGRGRVDNTPRIAMNASFFEE